MNDDEIDLSELFYTLWSYKLFIAFISASFLCASAYYALTADKIYRAKAVFQIAQTSGGGGFSIPGDLGGLAALAGIRAGSSNSADSLIERSRAREFILAASTRLSLDGDPHFNTYNPNSVDPLWKSTIKRLIGWESTERDRRAIVEDNIVRSFLKSVSIESTDTGALSITVSHADPERAALYANNLMEQLRTLVEFEKEQETEERLKYLSELLSVALIDLEESQQRLSDFSVENSVAPQVGLISEANRLEELRENIGLVKKFLMILPDLNAALSASDRSEKAYKTIRAKHPLVDDVRFRRIMGTSEAVSEWRWPLPETVDLVERTLSDRLERLTFELSEVESEAEVTAASVEEFARLTREATIAEATYTVMIEQVKAQSLTAGYKPETFKVFEYATPPLAPSEPKRNLILALGLVLGVFVGCALALILGIRKSVYFTRSALSSAVGAPHTIKIGLMKRLARLPLSVLRDRLNQRSHLQLDDLIIDLSGNKLILATSLNAQLTSSGLGRLIAVSAAKARKRVLFCDTTWHSSENDMTSPSIDFDTGPSIDGVDLLTASEDIKKSNIYTLNAFKDFVQNAMEDYDHVIVAGHDEYGKLAVKALKTLEPTVVFAARVGKTKKHDIAELKATLPVEVLLHD